MNGAHLVPMLSLSTSIIGTGAALGILTIAYRLIVKHNGRVPPGPPRYPIIGNVLNFPTQGWTQIFPEWHRKYGTHKFQPLYGPLAELILLLGNLVYANLMGMPVFVIGDREIAEELLNTRGKISASRLPNIMGAELCVRSLANSPPHL